MERVDIILRVLWSYSELLLQTFSRGQFYLYAYDIHDTSPSHDGFQQTTTHCNAQKNNFLENTQVRQGMIFERHEWWISENSGSRAIWAYIKRVMSTYDGNFLAINWNASTFKIFSVYKSI